MQAPSTASASPTHVLVCLQGYADAHAAADDCLRQCWWSLTKARRSSAGHISWDCNVREELEAQSVLKAIGNENMSLALLSGKTQEKNKQEEMPTLVVDDTEAKKCLQNTHAAVGLRNRKRQENPLKSPSWDLQNDRDTDKNYRAGEVVLCDPVDYLFGALPPRDVKVAQQQALEALQYYVKAANQQRRLIEHLNGKTTQ